MKFLACCATVGVLLLGCTDRDCSGVWVSNPSRSISLSQAGLREFKATEVEKDLLKAIEEATRDTKLTIDQNSLLIDVQGEVSSSDMEILYEDSMMLVIRLTDHTAVGMKYPVHTFYKNEDDLVIYHYEGDVLEVFELLKTE